MLGNLFYRGVQPSDLHRMNYAELCYWNEWHIQIEKGAERAAREAQAKAKK